MVDSYSRILMMEQGRGRFTNVGDIELEGIVYVFESLTLVSHISAYLVHMIDTAMLTFFFPSI